MVFIHDVNGAAEHIEDMLDQNTNTNEYFVPEQNMETSKLEPTNNNIIKDTNVRKILHGANTLAHVCDDTTSSMSGETRWAGKGKSDIYQNRRITRSYVPNKTDFNLGRYVQFVCIFKDLCKGW